MRPEVEEKWVVCRVCLQEDGNMQEIFSDENSEDLISMLHECGGIPIAADDHYPDKICHKCVRCLRVAHKFRKTCQQSHDQLTQILSTEPTLEVEEENDKTVVMNVNIDVEAPDVITETEVSDMNDCVKIETLDENGESVSYCYYEQGEIEDGMDAEFADYEIIEETEPIDDDIGQDILTSDEEYTPPTRSRTTVPKKTKQRVTSMLSIGEHTDQPLVQPEPKKKGRKPNDKSQTYICDVCGNIYRSQARLTEHMKFHSGVKPHECEICGRGFVQNQQLVRHMNTHTGNRPYKCNYCPAAFADRSTKTKHHRIHTKERPYECDVCGKTFTYSDNLKFHKMIHTGEKPHACDICGKGFTKAYKMRLHRTTHEKRGLIPPVQTVVKTEIETDA